MWAILIHPIVVLLILLLVRLRLVQIWELWLIWDTKFLSTNGKVLLQRLILHTLFVSIPLCSTPNLKMWCLRMYSSFDYNRFSLLWLSPNHEGLWLTWVILRNSFSFISHFDVLSSIIYPRCLNIDHVSLYASWRWVLILFCLETSPGVIHCVFVIIPGLLRVLLYVETSRCTIDISFRSLRVGTATTVDFIRCIVVNSSWSLIEACVQNTPWLDQLVELPLINLLVSLI